MHRRGRAFPWLVLAAVVGLQGSQYARAAESGKTISHLFDLGGGDAGELVLPTDVEVYGPLVYIVDSGNNRLVAFDRDGGLRFAVGAEGRGEGEFQDPVGLGIDRRGRVYVADTGNHRIQIFSADGQYLRAIEVSSAGKAVRPIDVAVHPKTDQIYVTGNNNHKVLVFDADGRLLREWGGNGAEAGKFRYPATIAATPNSDIAVVDVFNTRIQLFQPDGGYLVSIGEWGVLPGQLFRPKGVAVDSQGRVFVSDSYMNVIQVFNDSGEFLYLLRQESARRQLTTPSGIALGENNRLYVAEMLRHRVSVYRLN